MTNYHGKHVRPAAFRRQLRWLKKHFSLIPLAEIEKLVLEKKPPRERLCAITFDDGYRNNFLHAFPILRAGGVPATFFLTGDFVDKKIPLWTDRLEFVLRREKVSVDQKIRARLKNYSSAERQKFLDQLENKAGAKLELTPDSPYAPLSWPEIQTMAEAGMTFGAHTMSHPILSRLSREEQRRELTEAKKLIERKLGACPHFAYPNGQTGDWNQDTLELLRELGWSVAWTTIPRPVRSESDEPFALPRLSVHGRHPLAFWRVLAAGFISG